MLFGIKKEGYIAMLNYFCPPNNLSEDKIVVSSVFGPEGGETVVFVLDTTQFREPEFGYVLERKDSIDLHTTKVNHQEMCNKYNLINNEPKILLAEIRTPTTTSGQSKGKVGIGFYASVLKRVGFRILRMNRTQIHFPFHQELCPISSPTTELDGSPCISERPLNALT